MHNALEERDTYSRTPRDEGSPPCVRRGCLQRITRLSVVKNHEVRKEDSGKLHAEDQGGPGTRTGPQGEAGRDCVSAVNA